jgi:hypothetical protein
MYSFNFLQWLGLINNPRSEVIPLPDRILVYTDDVEEADGLWRARRLLDGRPLEIILGRRYTPSAETQKTW